MKYALMTLVLTVVGGPVVADTYPLTGDNTKIEFVGSKKDGKHTGGFKTVTGKAEVSGGTIAIKVEIDVDSIFSDDPKLTAHLKGADFFAVKDNPKATFTTTKVVKPRSGDDYTVTGDFTLLGKTKSITFTATIPSGDTFTLKAAFNIKRSDYGMTYGADKINDEVALTVTVNAKK